MNAKYFILSLLLSTILIQSGTSLTSMVFDILQHVDFGNDFSSTMKNLNKFSHKYSSNIGELAALESPNNARMMEHLQKALTALRTMAASLPNEFTRITILWQKIPLQYLHHEIIDHFKFIDRIYKAAMKFINKLEEKHEDPMLPGIIEILTGFKQSHLFGELTDLRTIISPPFPGVLVKSYPSILAIQLYAFEASHCGDQSFQLSTLEFFAWIIYMERKALAAGIIGFQLYSTQYDVDTTLSMERLKREFDHAYTNYHRVFGNELKNISTAIRACDGHTSGLDMTSRNLFLSLDKIQSDSRNNKVITGFKFIMHNLLTKIAITEAELLPYGKIGECKDDWKVRHDITNEKALGDHVTMNFDDIKLPENYVMTGIQFYESEKRETSENDVHIGMRIDGTPFDFKSGKLDYEKTKSFQSSNYHKKELPVPHSKQPGNLKCDQPLQPNSGIDEYVRFGDNQYDPDGIEQTTPLFDDQQVTSLPRVPLGGAGVFFKSSEDCEGFIALRAFTLDYADYFDEVHDNLPPTIFP